MHGHAWLRFSPFNVGSWGSNTASQNVSLYCQLLLPTEPSDALASTSHSSCDYRSTRSHPVLQLWGSNQGLCVIGKHSTKCIKSPSSLILSIIPGNIKILDQDSDRIVSLGCGQRVLSGQFLAYRWRSYGSSLLTCIMTSNSHPQNTSSKAVLYHSDL